MLIFVKKHSKNGGLLGISNLWLKEKRATIFRENLPFGL